MAPSTAWEMAMDRATQGWFNGFIGVALFSGTLPATRVALMDFDPVYLTMARAAIAGALAGAFLLLRREARPARGDVGALLVASLGVIIGFPLFTALALEHVTAARAAVFLGLLPLSTAVFGFLRGGERLPVWFWLFATMGSALVAGYAVAGGGNGTTGLGDLWMAAAVIICGLGYAEGGRLSRRLDGWRVICWSLVLSLPATLPVALLDQPDWVSISLPALMGLGYVSLFSMLLGFVFWYRGLALGGIAAVGQIQLIQPLLSLALAALLLGEAVGWDLALVSVAVVGCVARARRALYARAAKAL
jgi:drug/metabolite transporter (DMT)-like permease